MLPTVSLLLIRVLPLQTPLLFHAVMFYLYIPPSYRYGALSHLEVIHLAKHDIIGMSEGDSTQCTSVYCSPGFMSCQNFLHASAHNEEVAVACEIATKANSTILSLSI
jgi:dihydroxyacetone synthase